MSVTYLFMFSIIIVDLSTVTIYYPLMTVNKLYDIIGNNKYITSLILYSNERVLHNITIYKINLLNI